MPKDSRRPASRWTTHVEATTKVENYFRNSRAAPTCCVDARGVHSFFASGDVTAMTHEGEMLWSMPIIKTYGEVDNEQEQPRHEVRLESRIRANHPRSSGCVRRDA
ncbi:hypothetical protein [Rhodopirellula sp. P2]|uniref:hypothetical protein n=1 Tax=Rhodopirellula sp. P2 TaxID=2127060 RepID=UPI002368D205|nr:hypothetical protein [Rhodopirellula sp. P2]WDQ17110.1 hypothetical protein PSR62_00820 [Rhodopirellula sp. P2]